MKIKTILLAACAAFLMHLPAQAAITLDYDNVTGDYTLVGSDAGPGALLNVSGVGIIAVRYFWDFSAPVTVDEVRFIFNGIGGSTSGLVGTANGNTIISGAGANSTGIAGVSIETSPLETGELVFPSQTGTIGSGLWTAGVGTFIGTASTNVRGPTTSDLTINVTAVPEPATFAALAGILALGFVACRRRVRK